MIEETILFVRDREQGKILLAMKKVRFGAGKYNGTGGKVEQGETAAEAAVRETLEEVGVEVRAEEAQERGTIRFSFEDKPEWSRNVKVFVAEKWQGEPKETDEMAPEWFKEEEIPYEKMWIDDKHWLPALLRGEQIDAEFHFAPDGSAILRGVVNGRQIDQ